MTDDHALKIEDEPPVVGREANRNAWRGYMESFPRYVIYPERIVVEGARVAILGFTTGSHLGLPDEEECSLPVIWVAEARDGKLGSWAVVEDSPATRTSLRLIDEQAVEPETLTLGRAQGAARYMLGGRGLSGGDLVQLCCSGGWITGRFECDSGTGQQPTFYFSVEVGGGKVEQQSLVIPEGALLRRTGS